MNGDLSTPLYLGSSKKKRRRDRSGEPSRGKPVSKKWKPVWLWLQSLQQTTLVEPSEVIAWLDSNPEYAAEIRQHHTNGVFVAYAQKCHQRLLTGQYSTSKVETKKNRVSQPLRPPRLTDDSENSSGSRTVAENSHKGQRDLYRLQPDQQVAQNVVSGSTQCEPGEDEGSVLDPVTWRKIWLEKLNVKDSETGINATMNPEQRQGVSPYPTRIKRQREFYSPDDPEKQTRESGQEREPNMVPLEKMDTLTQFEL